MVVDNILWGAMQGPLGTFLSGLKKVIKIYPKNGIIVEHTYDPESSPPRLIQRQVTYLESA